jgi:hypothetical protein
MFNSPRQPNFALLLAAAWALVAAQLLYQHWGHTLETLNDTDDAMRLVQMRAFLEGQGWFDLHQARVQPTLGFDSHWSRLIDAGLAGLFLLFNVFVDAPQAERLMRAVWPLLWLLPAVSGAAALAWRIAGREAALVTVLFAVVGMPAFSQFTPGRIDHHNVQIALALLTAAATAWSDRVAWAAWAAGALTGLAVAIGFEGLPYVAFCGAVFALRYVIDPAGAAPLRAYGWSVVASVLGAFLISVAPGHWMRSACDMIAFNIVAPAMVGGALLACAAGRFSSASPQMRCAAVAVSGAAAVAVFALSEPRCLAGPFAMLDPEVWSVWLAHVQEMQPLLGFAARHPAAGSWFVAFPAVAALAALALARDARLRGDPGFLATVGVFLLAVATSLATIKGAPYAIWFGMPLVAALVVTLWRVLRIESLVPRFILGMLLTPAAVTAGAIGIAAAATPAEPADPDEPQQQACLATRNYVPLAQLPPGLVAANIDFGPFLLALTPHSALAAPYHRAAVGIIAAHHVFADPPEAAHAILQRFHATYVVTCGARGPAGMTEPQRKRSLWGRLRAGDVPDWLEPVPPEADQVFAVYRIRS